MRASVALVLLLPLVAGAQVQRTDEYLQRIDANGDGRVDLGEYQDWLSYAFDGMDRDRDGVLATHEQPGGKGAPITREQHRARLAERFRKQDVNRDGFLNAKEHVGFCVYGSGVLRNAPHRGCRLPFCHVLPVTVM